MVAQRHALRDRADLQGVDHVARERRPPADDLVAGIQRELRQVVDDAVGARAGGDLLEPDVVQLGERSPQAPRASVRIAVELLDAARERLARLRKRPERPLVGGELDHALEPELALHLLDRLPGLVGHQVPNGRLEERVGDLREAHGSTLSTSRPIKIASM